MAIQVNIFEAGSVPTAQELATLINELNTTLDESVTLTGEQSITGVKTFLGSKLIKFKQSASADKLGFTFYDYQGKEVGNFEYDNKNNFRLLALGNYYSSANQEIEGHVGFKVYNKSALAAYRLLCPLAGNAKNSIPSLTDTYTNFYMPLVFTNGALSVTTDNNGKVDLSTLIGSGGSGDVSDLATVATTGDYNDLLNKPILFSGNYNDLTNKPTLFSGSYGDLTDKPTLFSGDYNDLTNKPTIPVVDITKAQADGWYQPIGDYALTTDLFSGSYNDLTDKPSLFSGDYTDLTNKPTIPANISDLSDDSTHRLVTDTEKAIWNNKSDFSGSYNDLTNKPTIPTVPAISTNITTDASSDTKTASPKAVKDFVEGKGYLTQHQDISGKADQTDLEALEDRVDVLEQNSSGGGTNVVDSAISSTSEHALQNKVLYNELRITEQSSSQASVTLNGCEDPMHIYQHDLSNGTTLPIETIDADNLQQITWQNNGEEYTESAYLLPTLSENKAYVVTNSLEKAFVFSNEGLFAIKFDGEVSLVEADNQTNYASSYNGGFGSNVWAQYQIDESFEVGNNTYCGKTPDQSVAYYPTSTETSGSASIVKSLKTKIAELEARIEQISAQLQS